MSIEKIEEHVNGVHKQFQVLQDDKLSAIKRRTGESALLSSLGGLRAEFEMVTRLDAAKFTAAFGGEKARPFALVSALLTNFQFSEMNKDDIRPKQVLEQLNVVKAKFESAGQGAEYAKLSQDIAEDITGGSDMLPVDRVATELTLLGLKDIGQFTVEKESTEKICTAPAKVVASDPKDSEKATAEKAKAEKAEAEEAAIAKVAADRTAAERVAAVEKAAATEKAAAAEKVAEAAAKEKAERDRAVREAAEKEAADKAAKTAAEKAEMERIMKEDEERMKEEAARLAKESEEALAAQMAEDAANTGGRWVGDRLKDLDDLSILTSLNEEILLDTLDRRYRVDRIYTFTGAILLAINPFKRIAGMYDEANLRRFVAKKIAERREPHVFQIAYNAYQALCAKMKSQSILISGESGAGKTETTKYALKFIATAGAGGSGQVSPVEQRVLESNPLLEAFGNAKTSRNNNSSRFGKFIQLQFSHGRSVGLNNMGEELDRLKKIEVGSAGWRMVGACMQTYLLESVRVTKHNEGERNYHVFYQVFAAMEAGEGKPAVAAAIGRLKGNKMGDMLYMNQSKCQSIVGIDDLAEFKMMVHAMDIVGFSENEQANIFATLVAVLSLGNIVFECPAGKNEASTVSAESKKFLESAAASLGLSPDALHEALCVRVMQTGSEKVKVDNMIPQAQMTRDSLSMKLYNMIFEELVQKVNMAIGQVPGIETQCGVLDIFGFECFPTNSLEQLCINFANESLQQFFTTFVFKREEQMYKSEGIQWNPLDFPDNQDRLDLIVQKGIGIFPMLDEECFITKGSDKAFCEKVWKTHQKNKNFIIVKNNPAWFTISHFAGNVPYLTDNFMDKNKDALSPDCIEVLAQAGNTTIKEIFNKVLSELKEAAAAGGKKKRNTLVLQFQAQMTSLMTTVNSTDPHFIRCIKPTPLNKPNTWDSPYSAVQLRCGGVLQAIEVSRSGFGIRMSKSDVMCDLKCLAPKADYTDVEGLLKVVDARFNLSAEGQTWAVGKNLVFFKSSAHDIIQEHRIRCRDNVAKMLQKSRMLKQIRKRAVEAQRKVEERERLKREAEETERERLRLKEEERLRKLKEEEEARALEKARLREEEARKRAAAEEAAKAAGSAKAPAAASAMAPAAASAMAPAAAQSPVVRLATGKRSQDACFKCTKASASHVVIPCGHKALCVQCQKATTCPVCNGPVERVVEVIEPGLASAEAKTEADIRTMVDLGFREDAARAALEDAGGVLEVAIAFLNLLQGGFSWNKT